MPKGTPGEWEIDPHKDADLYVWISRDNGTGQREQLAGTAGRIERQLAGEILRDLRAASELLSALKGLVIRTTGLFDSYARATYSSGSNPDDDLSLMLFDARAAIAQAEIKL